MAEKGYPVVGEELTDATWRYLFGDQQGIINDFDGSSYGIALSTNSDVATIGSVSQDSVARVAGFGHRIPANEGQGVTVPPVTTGSQRTDVVALQYDPTYTGQPGPVRLVVIGGAPDDAGLPPVDITPPGVQNEPLWAVTRRSGQALSQATVLSLRRRVGATAYQPAGTPLPGTAPIGTTLTIGGAQYRRVLVGATPTWRQEPATFTATSTTRPPTSDLTTGSVVYETDTRSTPTWDGSGWQYPGLNLFGAGGTLLGTYPNPNTRFLVQAGTHSGTTDSTGYAQLVFPTRFPGGLLTVILTNGDDSASNDTTVAVAGAPWTTGEAHRVQYRLWGPPGGTNTRTPLAARNHRVNYIAIGW